jgi:methyltransferase family protein
MTNRVGCEMAPGGFESRPDKIGAESTLNVPNIISLLRCPITGDDLHFANADDIAKMSADTATNALIHLDGTRVRDVFDGFLRTTEGDIYYPVLNSVFILLPDFAIVPEADRKSHAPHLMPEATRAVMEFYDRTGWRKTDRGVFHDADINEDFREASREYIHRCHLRVNDHLPKHGKYLLDVASGPIQYDEYLSYSANFERRICCDVSFEALKAAALRLGDKGIYIQGDITNLPLKDGAVDAFVSLHTVYHVPAEKQILAFRELERVTRRGGSGVVVYTWGGHSRGAKIIALWRALAALRARVRTLLRPFVPDAWVRWLRRGRAPLATQSYSTKKYAASQYSFHAHDFDWCRRNVNVSGHWTLGVWRSVSVKFLQSCIPDNVLGRWMLTLIYALENLFPRALGRSGCYPMFVFKKPTGSN